MVLGLWDSLGTAVVRDVLISIIGKPLEAETTGDGEGAFRPTQIPMEHRAWPP